MILDEQIKELRKALETLQAEEKALVSALETGVQRNAASVGSSAALSVAAVAGQRQSQRARLNQIPAEKLEIEIQIEQLRQDQCRHLIEAARPEAERAAAELEQAKAAFEAAQEVLKKAQEANRQASARIGPVEDSMMNREARIRDLKSDYAVALKRL